MRTELVVLSALLSACSGASLYSDLPTGPYCASRTQGCCKGRQDYCSYPILGTRCYCDDFCDRRDRNDCCPDFFSHCRGETPANPIRQCYHNGKYVEYKRNVTDNCNTCVCEEVRKPEGTILEMLCETDVCMLDANMINAVNGESHVVGWTATNHTEFWGHKLLEGLTYRLGTVEPQRFVMKMVPVRRVYDPRTFPQAFDSTVQWRDYVSPIKDQFWCGSSWAISTAQVASDRFAIMSEGQERVSLSYQQLLSCNKKGQHSCKGGQIDRAWMFLRKTGVVDEDCYPYHGQDEKCRITKSTKLNEHCPRKPMNANRKFMYKTGPAYRLGNETDIMYEILMNGPVQATMKVYQDFFSYQGGVYRNTNLSSNHRTAYHSVRIVGWGEDRSFAPPRKYWKVANSWGTGWGEDGYFRIERGRNECDIETFVIAAWAKPVQNSKNEVFHNYSR